MSNLRVRKSRKDGDGDITALCGSFGTTLKDAAIAQIDGGVHRYYVSEGSDAKEYDVKVVRPEGRVPYLRTEPGGGEANNLDNLPSC